jgi:hypothetical protein
LKRERWGSLLVQGKEQAEKIIIIIIIIIIIGEAVPLQA